MGTIQCVRDRKKHVRVVNGQHRLQAILEILREDTDMKFNMPLMFEVYDIPIDDLQNINIDFTEIEQIYETANKSLIFTASNDKDIFCRFIVKAMQRDSLLCKGLIDKDDGKVYRPRILVKELYEALKEYLPDGYQNMSVDDILSQIKHINVDISLMSLKQLFGRSDDQLAKSKLSQYNKAKNINFFLNLDGKFQPSVWISMLKK